MVGGVNVQDGNVGNRGDVVKHRLIVDALSALARAFPEHDLVYVDTHAYSFEASLPQKNLQFVQSRGPCDEYYLLENDYIKRGRYLCSVGLAQAMSRSFRRAFFVISELMPEYLERIRESFADEECHCWFSSEFKVELLSAALAETRNPVVFMLVDPFSYAKDPQSVEIPISAAASIPVPAVVQVFNYGERLPAEVVPTDWTMWRKNDHPYYHALIASQSMIDQLVCEIHTEPQQLSEKE